MVQMSHPPIDCRRDGGCTDRGGVWRRRRRVRRHDSPGDAGPDARWCRCRSSDALGGARAGDRGPAAGQRDGTEAELVGSIVDGNRILMIGDSILASTSSRYGNHMCEAVVPLGWQVAVEAEPSRFVEFGNQVLDRLLRDDADPEEEWNAAVVFLGTNYRGNAVQYEAELVEILDRLAPRPVVLFTVTEYRSNYVEVNEVVNRLGAERDNVTVPKANVCVRRSATILRSGRQQHRARSTVERIGFRWLGGIELGDHDHRTAPVGHHDSTVATSAAVVASHPRPRPSHPARDHPRTARPPDSGDADDAEDVAVRAPTADPDADTDTVTARRSHLLISP
jgi:hypothetical protein